MEEKYPSFTAVLHSAVKSAPSGLDAQTIAATLGKPYPTFMSEISRQPNHKLGADLILPIIDLTGSIIPMQFLARKLGGVFIKVPPASQQMGSELLQTLADSVKEFGEFASETAQSISDGKIPADQLARIQKEGHEAVESIMQMLKLARLTHEAQFQFQGSK